VLVELACSIINYSSYKVTNAFLVTTYSEQRQPTTCININHIEQSVEHMQNFNATSALKSW